ncbi:MAG: HPr(Ser) kinase/phosphatase [Clostridia bacterium]|nr:HPr(Ser) kinase/phosphatase [Oscillospiraceae bacterium]MBQ7033997.1 HPr(Ser) kinase/phosphatase [Clostridia bacterium]
MQKKPEITVPLKNLIEEFSLEVIYKTEDLEERMIRSKDVLRPGMQLATGFFDYFDNERISVLGKMENTYLAQQTPERRQEILERLFAEGVPCFLITRGLEVFPEIIAAAQKHNTPVLRTNRNTSSFIAALIASLHVHLAPRITRHGVLVEVYGEGILLLGESGVGKSETAIELVKRGHRLVADDAVEIKRVSAKTLVGSAPEMIRHFIELRGIGIVDVQRIFGTGSVKETERIDFILNFEPWQTGKFYDRLGLESEHTELLGVEIPSLTVPVKPGRNLAVIVEVAAMNNKQKKMGYNAAAALNDRWMNQKTE